MPFTTKAVPTLFPVASVTDCLRLEFRLLPEWLNQFHDEQGDRSPERSVEVFASNVYDHDLQKEVLAEVERGSLDAMVAHVHTQLVRMVLDAADGLAGRTDHEQAEKNKVRNLLFGLGHHAPLFVSGGERPDAPIQEGGKLFFHLLGGTSKIPLRVEVGTVIGWRQSAIDPSDHYRV